MLCKNLRWLLNRIVLIVYHTNNHALEYQICLCRVSMGRCEQTISERVIAVIKLRDVAPKVLLYGEFASWVDFFIAIRSQDQVVADNKSVSNFNSLFNLSRSPASQTLACHDLKQLITLHQLDILSIEPPQEALMHSDQKQEHNRCCDSKCAPKPQNPV